jgi:hypothetical protein
MVCDGSDGSSDYNSFYLIATSQPKSLLLSETVDVGIYERRNALASKELEVSGG